MTARTAVAVMAGTVAWYLHPQHSPWPAPGTVPIVDMVELRNPGAYLLLRAWWFLAPLATAATLAALMPSRSYRHCGWPQRPRPVWPALSASGPPRAPAPGNARDNRSRVHR